MRPGNWNDLRYLLAVWRGQTLTNAARRLHVDDTTVSRRLAALQARMGMQLVQRQGDGRLMLTAAGEAVARRAEQMEQQFDSINDVVSSDQDPCAGTVRVTSVPILVNRLLARFVGAVLERHPGLIVELVPDPRDLSLTRREADLAIRLARPATGGTSVKARRIGALEYAAYTSTAVKLRDVRHLPWICFDETMSHLPQARWMARAAKDATRSISGLRVHDAETALEAAAAGLGITLLPTAVADRDTRLRPVPSVGIKPCPSRDIWLLAHADQIKLARVATVIKWVEGVIAASARK
jgi:DNA-binding transcriptional LysR family regulator